MVSVASVTTRLIACTPSGSVEVSKASEPDALSRHGTTLVNGFAHAPPLPSTVWDATTVPSTTSLAR